MSIFDGNTPRRERFSISARDDWRDRLVFASGGPRRERGDGDREDLLRQSLEAWRTNPLARRIVGLTSQYVVGGGIGVECPHEPTHRFLREFWEDRLNRMDMRVFDWRRLIGVERRIFQRVLIDLRDGSDGDGWLVIDL